MKEFFCKTKIVCGRGALSVLGTLGAQRVLVVADPYFAGSGTALQVAGKTGAENVEIFSDVEPNPSVALAAKGTAAVKAFAPDLIVALGGGSAMDCAKAMLYFSGMDARLVAVPTTSGSGSEVTDFAVLTHDRVKHPLVDARLVPDLAILDDTLLMEMPKSLIADAGFDVLAHAVEGFVATGASPMTDALARDAFCSAFAALPASFAGNRDVRLKIHTAATMAGIAFSQAGLGMCHAISHTLGGMYHISHGRLNAILLPEVLSCNAHGAGGKYAAMARAAGLSGSADSVAVRNLKNALIRLRRELQLPQTLAQAGVDPREIWRNMAGITAAVLADPCCKTNPIPVEDFMVRQVLEAVTGSV